MPMFAGSVAAVDEVQLSSELRGQVQRMLTSGLPPQKQQEAANCLLVRCRTMMHCTYTSWPYAECCRLCTKSTAWQF